MHKISVIIPCYNEEAALPYFFTEIRKVADNMTATKGLAFEFLYIDDGSKDGTLNLLREFAAEDNRVRYISFSRNFGKEAAMYAGFQHAAGDFAVLMDADLQHPPDMLEEMYLAITEEGFDIAAAQTGLSEGGAAYPLVLCPLLLPVDQQNIQSGVCRWSL